MTQINAQTNISSSKSKLPTELRALKAELQILQLTLWFFLCLTSDAQVVGNNEENQTNLKIN